MSVKAGFDLAKTREDCEFALRPLTSHRLLRVSENPDFVGEIRLDWNTFPKDIAHHTVFLQYGDRIVYLDVYEDQRGSPCPADKDMLLISRLYSTVATTIRDLNLVMPSDDDLTRILSRWKVACVPMCSLNHKCVEYIIMEWTMPNESRICMIFRRVLILKKRKDTSCCCKRVNNKHCCVHLTNLAG